MRYLFLLFAVSAFGQQYALPNHTLTPGAIDSTLVADLSGKSYIINKTEHNICAKDFRTEPFRFATKNESIKKGVCQAYGIHQGCPGPGYELDDLLPIEAGGKNVTANLWPQPIGEAHIKDHMVEDKLPDLICSGKIDIKDAQSCIIGNWVSCMQRIQGLE